MGPGGTPSDPSTAQKCRVCRRSGAGGVSQCVSCKHLYHWSCLRPALLEQPEPEWQCNTCRPAPSPQRRPRARAQAEEVPLYEESEEEIQGPVEEECRVCTSPGEDMIFCTQCPAAFHKTCHDPPMLLCVRPGWECMECKAPKRKKVRGRLVGPKPSLPSALLRQARANATMSPAQPTSPTELAPGSTTGPPVDLREQHLIHGTFTGRRHVF